MSNADQADTTASLGSGPDPLGGSVADFHGLGGAHLLDRWLGHQAWWDARLAAEVDPYCKALEGMPGALARCVYRDGRVAEGVNFASQDYLSLSTHPDVIHAVRDAVRRYGLHSAGSAALMGNTTLSIELERALARFLGVKDCTLFSTGWGAGYGLIRTFVSPRDHVVLDILAHACLHEGAWAATKQVHRVPHLSAEGIERRLRRIRADDRDAGILVITEALFSMDSDSPDIGAIQALCRRHDAVLMVDVAHDFGAMGATGRGLLEDQGQVGAVDIIMGSFSKTFATNGGFVATDHPAVKMALRSSGPTQTFTNAIGPLGAAIALACLSIVESDEGARRRAALIDNAEYLRGGLTAAGFDLLGRPSAIVPVVLGEVAHARRMTRAATRDGALVNLVEYPAVPRAANRWRLQLMADHRREHLDRMTATAVDARDKALAAGTR
jgi:glycine C-acetyltransferase